MGVFTFQDEKTSSVAPARLYKALVKDSDNLIPKVVDAIQNIEIVEGNGCPGTIKKFTFIEGGKTNHVLHKIEAVDEANHVYNYSIDGGDLPDTLEKISFQTKLVAAPNGGTIGKVSVKYFTKGDAKPTEEEIRNGKGKGDAFFKAIEDYLLSNSSYN